VSTLPYEDEPVVLPCTSAFPHDHNLSIEMPDERDPDDSVTLVVVVAGGATASVTVTREDLIRALGGTP